MIKNTTIPTKICEQCQKTFAKDPRCTHKYFQRQRFCSQTCAGENWSKCRPPRDQETVFRTWFDAASNGCWEWEGAKDKDGYGIFSFEKKTARAHRVALQLSGIDVPKGGLVCHTCDNPSCVNPNHLYLGSNRQNSDDKVKRGRSLKGARHYMAKLTDNDVIAIRQSTETAVKTAKQFGISSSNVVMIRQRRTWTHLP